MHIVDDELLFDIADEHERMDGDIVLVGEYSQQTVDAFVEAFGVEAVKKCMKSICDYAFNPDVVSLNLVSDDVLMLTPDGSR